MRIRYADRKSFDLADLREPAAFFAKRDIEVCVMPMVTLQVADESLLDVVAKLSSL